MSKTEGPWWHKNYDGDTYTTTRAVNATNGLAEIVVMPPGSLVQMVNAKATSQPAVDGVCMVVVFLLPSGQPDPRMIYSYAITRDVLEPEPGLPDWSPADFDNAAGQGWEIKARDPEEGESWSLGPATDGGRFPDDRAAIEFVWRRALLGDDLAKKALAFLRARAPERYADIKLHCNKETS